MAEMPHSDLFKMYEACLADCRELKHQVGRLEGERQQWVSHCLILKATSDENVVQFEKAIADLAGELAEAKNGKEHLQGQVEALKEEVKLKDRANQAAQAKIIWLKADKEQLVEDLQTQSSKYQKAINDCTREAGEAKDGRQHMQEQVEALKEELKLKDIANEAAQAKIFRLEAQNAQALEDLWSQRSDTANMLKVVSDLKAVNVELIRLVTETNKQRVEDQHALQELANIKADNSRLQMDNSRLQMDNSRLQMDNSRLQMDNSKLRTDNLRRLLDLGAQSSKVVEFEKLVSVQKAELAARQADVEELAWFKAELRRKRAQVLNLHKQKEQWKAEEKYAHGLNQQLWGAVTMLEGKLQELQQNTTLVEQPPAVVDADGELQAYNTQLQRVVAALRAKVTKYGKVALDQKRINVELTKLVTELQDSNKQQENELNALSVVKTDVISLRDKLRKSKKLNEYLKAKQQQMHSRYQQLKEKVAQLERQLQQDNSTMVQQTARSDDVVATAQAALKPVAVVSSNTGRESGPQEPSTPELGDDSCKSS